MKIIEANAEYTGGGIYRYTAQTEEGWLLANSEWDCIYLMDADPNETEDSWYNEWCDEHEQKIYEDEEYFSLIHDILEWIILNKPQGNYDVGDIRRKLVSEMETMRNIYCSADGWISVPFKTETFQRGEYYIDIVTMDDIYEAWLYRPTYGIKSLIFGANRDDTSYNSFKNMIEANIEDYIEDYKEEVEDED